jgi:hypothetical protein
LLSTSTSWDGIKLSYPTDSAVISVVTLYIPLSACWVYIITLLSMADC